MSFWRRELIDFALDQETQKHIAEQREWILREPCNAQPYYHLAQLFRIQSRADEALALMLEAVRLDPLFANAHAALTELYAVRNDYAAAWRHARAAETAGNKSAVDMLTRHNVSET